LRDVDFKMTGNQVLKTIKERQSVRSFLDKIIEDEILNQIIDAGIRAPTSGNLQPYSLVVVKDKDKKEIIAQKTYQKFIKNADTLIFLILDFHRIGRWAKLSKSPFAMGKSLRHFLTAFHDVICCAQNMVIAAESLGIGSVFIGNVIELSEEFQEILNLPSLTFPSALLCLGYPDKIGKRTKRLATEVIVHRETYQSPDDDVIRKWYDEKYDDKKLELDEKLIWLYLNVVLCSLGEDAYCKAKEDLEKAGGLNIPQYLFGIQYQAHAMPKVGYKIRLDLIKAGFDCFKDEL
jgi:nitroreductase